MASTTVKEERRNSSLPRVMSKADVRVNQLATHLPDQVVFTDHTRLLPYQLSQQGALMFLDISGFTALCERYSMNAKNGTDKLTKTLNGYMGALVQEILAFDGDILKYAGDAILTLWTVEGFKDMQQTIIHVLRCAFSVQEKYGEWLTTVGVKLRVKLGIAAGALSVMFLGTDEFRHYVTLGRAVQAVNAAEAQCSSGDIVLSPSAWCHVTKLPLVYTELKDRHRLVTGFEEDEITGEVLIEDTYSPKRTVCISRSTSSLITKLMKAGVASSDSDPVNEEIDELTGVRSRMMMPEARSEQRTSSHPKISASSSSKLSYHLNVQNLGIKRSAVRPIDDGPQSISIGMPAPLNAARTAANIVSMQGIKETENATAPKGTTDENERVREAILKETGPGIADKLRLYIAPPVLRKLDDKQPLEYLSEMRQVTICFINLMTDETTKYAQAIYLQTAFVIIYNTVKKMQGCLNKVFMFDKGATILVIFGLPGFKHENDCAHALQWAFSVVERLNAVESITKTSIGVTTGSTFCGVVGHDHRHEYTVIGRKVNMAARLMMYYPGMVTCDNETYHHSKLPKSSFSPVEVKQLKGIKNIGTIRQFNGSQGTPEVMQALTTQEFQYPILGRQDELSVLSNEFTQIRHQPEKGTQRQVIIFEGEPGIGKTRMLDGAILEAMKYDITVISCGLTIHDNKLPYFAVKSLLMNLLELNLETPHQERESHLLGLFKKSKFIMRNLSLLNDLLQLKFPHQVDYGSLGDDQVEETFHKLLFEIVHETGIRYGFVLFAVDDAHFMDLESWKFVADLGQDMKSLVLLTIRSSSMAALRECPGADMVLKMPTLLKVTLGGIAPQYMAALACQLLDVIQIPKELEKMLQQKSHGVPAWCDQLLQDLLFTDIIMTVPYKKRHLYHIQTGEMCSPNLTDISRRTSTPAFKAKKLGPIKNPKEQAPSMEDDIICILNPEKNLECGMPDSIKGMIQARIDRMGEAEQMILKCAAILGMTFPRIMLESLLPERYRQLLSGALNRLIAQDIFECVWLKFYIHSDYYDVDSDIELTQPGCRCPNRKGPHCNALRFLSHTTQETAYEMFVESSRQSLHLLAAQFLESYNHTCITCGGKGFLIGLDSNASFEKHVMENYLTMCRGNSGMKSKESSAEQVTAGYYSSRACRRSSEARRTLLNQVAAAGISAGATSQPCRKGYSKLGGSVTETSARDSGPEPYSSKQCRRASRMGDVITPQPLTFDEDEKIDTRDCTCVQIMAAVLPQLVRHWRAAGNTEKTVQFLMEAGAVSLTCYNNMEALIYLEEVSRITQAVKENKNPFEGEATVTDQYLSGIWEEAKLESLLGQTYHQQGQYKNATIHFEKCLALLGNKQPKNKSQFWRRMRKERLVQWTHIHFADSTIGKANPLLAHRLIEQIRCLRFLFQQSVVCQNEKVAVLAAFQQLNIAEYSNSSLHELILSYTTMMRCCMIKDWRKIGNRCEFIAQVQCSAAPKKMNTDALSTLAQLYFTSLMMHLTWGDIDLAIQRGFLAMRVVKQMNDADLLIQLLPNLAQVLICADRVVPCVETLNDLRYVNEETHDVVGKMCYFTCCWQLILSSGFQLETAQTCRDFAEELKTDKRVVSEHSAFYVLASSMCLWMTRKEQWKNATEWRDLARQHRKQHPHDYMSVLGRLHLCESDLITLSYSLSKEGDLMVITLSNDCKQELKALKVACKKISLFQPRVMLLTAYYRILMGQRGKAKKLLHKSYDLSVKMGCVMDEKWASYNELAWFDPVMNQEQREIWVDQVKMKDIIRDWQQASDENLANSVTYPLPLTNVFEK